MTSSQSIYLEDWASMPASAHVHQTSYVSQWVFWHWDLLVSSFVTMLLSYSAANGCTCTVYSLQCFKELCRHQNCTYVLIWICSRGFSDYFISLPNFCYLISLDIFVVVCSWFCSVCFWCVGWNVFPISIFPQGPGNSWKIFLMTRNNPFKTPNMSFQYFRNISTVYLQSMTVSKYLRCTQRFSN